MPEVLKFPSGEGDRRRAAREQKRRAEETKEFKDSVDITGLVLGDHDLEFHSPEEFSMKKIVSLWKELIEESDLDKFSPEVTTEQQSVATSSSAEELRLSAVDGYYKIAKLTTVESRQKFWQENPQLYMNLVVLFGRES